MGRWWRYERSPHDKTIVIVLVVYFALAAIVPMLQQGHGIPAPPEEVFIP
jgi:hypothetical protein